MIPARAARRSSAILPFKTLTIVGALFLGNAALAQRSGWQTTTTAGLEAVEDTDSGPAGEQRTVNKGAVAGLRIDHFLPRSDGGSAGFAAAKARQTLAADHPGTSYTADLGGRYELQQHRQTWRADAVAGVSRWLGSYAAPLGLAGDSSRQRRAGGQAGTSHDLTPRTRFDAGISARRRWDAGAGTDLGLSLGGEHDHTELTRGRLAATTGLASTPGSPDVRARELLWTLTHRWSPLVSITVGAGTGESAPVDESRRDRYLTGLAAVARRDRHWAFDLSAGRRFERLDGAATPEVVDRASVSASRVTSDGATRIAAAAGRGQSPDSPVSRLTTVTIGHTWPITGLGTASREGPGSEAGVEGSWEQLRRGEAQTRRRVVALTWTDWR